MVAEAEDFHVVDLAQRHIDRQLVGERLVRLADRFRVLIEGMHVADQGAARMRDIGDVGVHRDTDSTAAVFG